jgi:hypothetical protein
MPTLRPQRLSGLVVTPTVEQGGGIHRASIAIDVGVSRAGTPQVVSREDLVVELKNPPRGASSRSPALTRGRSRLMHCESSRRAVSSPTRWA